MAEIVWMEKKIFQATFIQISLSWPVTFLGQRQSTSKITQGATGL